jgi:hypothetical protein
VNFTDPFPDVLPQLSSIAASLLSLSRFDARFLLWTVLIGMVLLADLVTILVLSFSDITPNIEQRRSYVALNNK